jgi:hypothetical protein
MKRTIDLEPLRLTLSASDSRGSLRDPVGPDGRVRAFCPGHTTGTRRRSSSGPLPGDACGHGMLLGSARAWRAPQGADMTVSTGPGRVIVEARGRAIARATPVDLGRPASPGEARVTLERAAAGLRGRAGSASNFPATGERNRPVAKTCREMGSARALSARAVRSGRGRPDAPADALVA